MSFLSTAIISIDTLPNLPRTEQPIGFDDRPFPMYPLRLNGIQPRALDRQPASEDADTLAGLLDVLIMLPQPPPDLVADVPRRVVPDQQHGGKPLGRQPLAAP